MSITLRKKKLKDGRISLYLDTYHLKKRTYETLELYLTKDKVQNKQTMELASAIRSKREVDLKNNQYGFQAPNKSKGNFVEYFVTVSKIKEPDWGHTWGTVAGVLKEYTGGRLAFSDINDKWLEEFKKHIQLKVGQNTARSYFSKIKACVRLAIKEDYIIGDPLKKLKPMPHLETKVEYLTFEEVETLAATPCQYPEVKRAFLFACFTGLRLSDCEKLTWGELKNFKIAFRQKKTKNVEYMDMNQTAIKLVCQNDEANILHLPDQQVFNLPSRATLTASIPLWAAQAGLKKHVTFHVSRHTFGTMLCSQGVDIYTVSKLLGHRELRTTQIYAKIIDSKKKNAIDSLPQLEVI